MYSISLYKLYPSLQKSRIEAHHLRLPPSACQKPSVISYFLVTGRFRYREDRLYMYVVQQISCKSIGICTSNLFNTYFWRRIPYSSSKTGGKWLLGIYLSVFEVVSCCWMMAISSCAFSKVTSPGENHGRGPKVNEKPPKTLVKTWKSMGKRWKTMKKIAKCYAKTRKPMEKP